MKHFTIKQLFSIIDGRLSSTIDDVYDILDYTFDTNFLTHQLPVANDYLKLYKPDWYLEAENELNTIKNLVGDNFKDLMNYINKNNSIYEVTKLNFNKKEFGDYMVKNSLLLTRKH